MSVVDAVENWDTRQQLLHQCQIILNERLDRVRQKLGSYSITGEVLEGDASSLISKTAKHHGADLIIIGSHGDTGPRKSRIGSVAAAVVNEAPCSVEVVKLVKGRGQKTASGAVSGESARD
jgi:nucleotide-binding universal stress UspA family protein